MAETKNDQISANIAIIAAAYLGNPSNPVERHQIVDVIREISTALTAPAAPETPPEAEKPKLSPAAIRKSISHDHIISFIDNKSYKSLKRHLSTHGHTPKSYREHFGLKSDYPMVAPSYSEQRSALARKAGLGQRAATAAAAPAVAETPAASVAAPAALAAQTPAAKPKAAKSPAVKTAAATAPAETKPPAKPAAPKAAKGPAKASPKRAAVKA